MAGKTTKKAAAKKKTAKTSAKVAKKSAAKRVAAKPTLLAGGNPQIRDGRRRRPRAGLHRGHAGVETRRRAAPRRAHRAHRAQRAQGGQVELALLWHRGPGLVPQLPLLYEYVKVAFFRGTSLRPVPPGASKHKDVRYVDIRRPQANGSARRGADRRPGSEAGRRACARLGHLVAPAWVAIPVAAN